MVKRRETIDASVEDYAAEKRRAEDAHPEVEELVAYHDGGLDAEARERIREHLTFCRDCSGLVLDLAGFAELAPPSEEHRLSAQDVAERKAELMARIRDEERPSAKLLEFTRRPEPPPAERRPPIPVWYHGLAAALLAATIGLSLWVVRLDRQLAAGASRPSAARLNTVVKDLLPVDDSLRGSANVEAVVVPSGNDLVLLLTFLKDVPYDDYRIVIFDEAGGRPLQTYDGLELQSEGLFTMTFPRDLSGGGKSFRLKVLGLGAGDAEPLAEYVLTIGAESGPEAP
jgi:hypothetical protein